MNRSAERLDLARDMVRKEGGELEEFYLTMGRYDMVAFSEAEDETAVARAMLKLGQGGAIRSETFRAFTEKEYREIVGSL